MVGGIHSDHRPLSGELGVPQPVASLDSLPLRKAGEGLVLGCGPFLAPADRARVQEGPQCAGLTVTKAGLRHPVLGELQSHS